MQKSDLQLEAARNPALAQRLVKYRLPRKGEELKWAAHPHAEIVQDAIYRVIGELPDKLYDVIVARYGEQVTLEEYGERINRTRERVRQLEARGLRMMRVTLIAEEMFFTVEEVLEIVAIPGGPFDPAWVSVKEAARLTELSLEHIRALARDGLIEARPNEYKRNEIQILKESLKAYVLGSKRKGRRRRGVWKG